MDKVKLSYEQVLADVAAYIAQVCQLSSSEAVGVVMNDDRTEDIIKEIKKGGSMDIETLARLYLQDPVCP